MGVLNKTKPNGKTVRARGNASNFSFVCQWLETKTSIGTIIRESLWLFSCNRDRSYFWHYFV